MLQDHTRKHWAEPKVNLRRQGPTDQICCLVDGGERCSRPAGNASYSKRIQKTVTQRRLQLSIDNLARHIYICDYHKAIIQCARTKRRRKDSEEDSNETDTDLPEVDLYQLQVNTLRRYKRHFKVSTRPGLNKAQLADTLMKHFKSIPVKEKDILTFFIYTVKSNSNKLEQKNGITVDAT
ncbi:SIN3-associated polypeptide 30 [Carabus blaptoides fortunei]